MKIIIGQGNPGSQYAKTRHNIGFMVLDYLANQHKIIWQAKPKWKAEIAEFNHQGQKVLLVKPTCFYNLTGEVVRTIGDFYKLDFSNDILVIHDDIDLGFGTIRTRQQGSAGGNNGLKSIITHIGQDFWRIKIGSKNSSLEQISNTDFVLGKISAKEQKKLNTILPQINSWVNDFINEQLEITSLQEYNG